MPENKMDVQAEGRLYEGLRQFWHPVAYSEELTDSPQQAILFGQRLVVARLGGKVIVWDDLCRHRGTALSLGWIEGNRLRCAYHGWTYDDTGSVCDIPARPELSGRLKVQIPSYPVVEQAGLVWTCLEPDPKFPPAEFPELDDPSYRTIHFDAYEWNCSLARRLENYFDFSHFAWVHDGILGDRSQARIADYEVKRVGAEIRMLAGPFVEYTTNVKNSVVAQVTEGQDETYEAWKRYRVYMPNGMLLNSSAGPNGEDYVLFVALAPVSPKVTRCFTFVARNYAFEEDDAFRQFQYVILSQDKPVVESQRPEELPEDLAEELHVKGADLGTLEYRKWLLDIIDGKVEMAQEPASV
jgi:phenylpropionate dioxygenase-like ring-hydroxylating dioxygenase large terminal subunit